MWIKERIEQCETCENAKKTYNNDIHEICEAGICILCYQFEKIDCDCYKPVN
jgi:hypothetical protein